MKRKLASLLSISLILGMGLAGATTQWHTDSAVQEFATGAVLLATGDTLHGPVKFYQELDMISLVGPDQLTKAFTAGQIVLFAVQGGGHIVSELTEPNAAATAQRILSPPYVPTVARRNYYRPFTSPINAWDRVAMSLADERQAAQLALQPASAPVRLFRTLAWNHDKGSTQLPTPALFEQLTNGPYLLLRRQRLELTTVAADQQGRPALPVLVDRFYVADSAGKVVRLTQPKRDLLTLLGARGGALRAYASQQQLRFDNAAQLSALVTYANDNLLPARR